MDFEEWYDQHFGSADPNVVKAGNIDLGNRPPVYNDDGTVSTEKSFSIGDEYGREILLPQVVDGKMLSKKDAIAHYRDTGEHLGIYKDIPTANAYAKSIHERSPRLDTPDTFPVGEAMQSIRAAPGWIANRIYQGATKTLPPPPPAFNPWSLQRATQNLIDMTGEGPSAREQEAAMPPAPYFNDARSYFDPTSSAFLDGNAPVLNPSNWSLQNPAKNLRDLKDTILPPGFSVQRGIDSALAPAKWLFNEIRQGVLSDDDLAEIKRDPYSARSIAAYAQAGIALSGGKGGELGPKGAVPEHIWNSWKPFDPGPGKTYIAGQGGEIRVDDAGNHFQLEGTHQDQATGQNHVVVKPVEAPGSGTAMTPSETNDLLQNLHEPEKVGPVDINWYNPKSEQPNPFYKFMTGNEPPPPAEGPPSNPPKPEPGSIMDEWSKKHNDQVPDFTNPPPLTPYNPREPLGPLEPNVIPPPGLGKRPNPFTDYEPPPITNYTKPVETGPPPEKGIWDDYDNLVSEWDKTKEGMTARSIQDWEDAVRAGDVTREQADAAIEAIKAGGMPPLPLSPKLPPELPDPKMQSDWDNIYKWNQKRDFLRNRFNWKPPPHGGNNL